MAGPPLGTPVNTRYCKYCNSNQPAQQFVRVFTVKKRRFVGWKCHKCVEISKLPKAEREARSARLKEEADNLNKVKSDNLQALKQERRLKQLKDEVNG